MQFCTHRVKHVYNTTAQHNQSDLLATKRLDQSTERISFGNEGVALA